MDDSELSKAYSSLKEKYAELKETSGNAITVKYRYALLLDKAAEMDKQVRRLKSENDQLQDRIEKLEQTQDDKVLIVHVDRCELGKYVPQAKHMKVLDELKQLKQQKNEHTDKENRTKEPNDRERVS